MTENISMKSPLIKRILAWMDERFPFKNTPVWIVWYLLAATVARYTADDAAIEFGFHDLFGAMATWSFFLLLRVFDEHKDYELDLHNHPERVLQSGLITLFHLKIIGAICVLFQFVWGLYLDKGIGVITISWAVMFGYSLLMAKEFFIGEWLERRLVLYALSHQIIIPMIIWWMCVLAEPSAEPGLVIYWLMGLSFATGMTLEIVRKTRGPEEERDTVDSYSKVFGTQGSAYVVMLLLTFMLLQMLAICGFVISDGFYIGYGVILLMFFFAQFTVLKFVQKPSLGAREKNEMACALFMLVGYIVLIWAVLSERLVNFSIWV